MFYSSPIKLRVFVVVFCVFAAYRQGREDVSPNTKHAVAEVLFSMARTFLCLTISDLPLNDLLRPLRTNVLQLYSTSSWFYVCFCTCLRSIGMGTKYCHHKRTTPWLSGLSAQACMKIEPLLAGGNMRGKLHV